MSKKKLNMLELALLEGDKGAIINSIFNSKNSLEELRNSNSLAYRIWENGYSEKRLCSYGRFVEVLNLYVKGDLILISLKQEDEGLVPRFKPFIKEEMKKDALYE